MSIMSAFGFKTNYSLDSELPEIYPLDLKFDVFVQGDIVAIYSKILTDCVERTNGIKDEVVPAVWDNCLASESSKGLVSLLAESMATKSELFLVYKDKVLRRANSGEEQKIRDDYKQKAESKIGVFISFKNFKKTDFLKIYSEMEYSVLDSLNKSLNLASAIQFKMSKMRESVGAIDATQIIAQTKTLARALACGKDIVLDSEDMIETAKIDMEPTAKAIAFLDAKRAFYLDLPLSYINGEQTAGIGSTGEADTKAVERGLKHYWISILHPALLAIFGIDTEFKSQDFRQITSALEALKTFELTGEDMISLDNKRLITSKLFDVEDDIEGEREPQFVDQIPAQGPPQKDSASPKDKKAGK